MWHAAHPRSVWPLFDPMAVNGASRARTGDLLHAMQALSQLSYSPELVLRGPVYTEPLIVLGWSEPEGYGPSACDERDRKQVDLVERQAVCGERVDLGRHIRPTHIPISAAPAGNGRHSDDV